jgi:spore coat polysaccharide biosynthesis protein SpsF
MDVEELDRLLDLHLRMGSDFSHSFGTLPIGVGAEVFTFEALKASFLEGHAPHHREHVDEFLLENPERFKTSVLMVAAAKNRPNVRLTVDTEEDYHRACFIVEHAKTDPIDTEEAIELCLRYA